MLGLAARHRALAVALTTLLVSLTRCGPAAPDGPADDRLRVSLKADPAMVDPITYSELLAGDVIANMYESLAALDENGAIVPSLAVTWEAHEDHHGFRFELRRGVKFHSGREMTAADVAWSLTALLRPGGRGGLNQKYAASIEGADRVLSGDAEELTGIRILDDHTFDVRFEHAEVLFPIYPIYIMDRGVVDEHGPGWAGSVSAGTGPFHFVEWQRGQRIRLEAHEDYWGGAPSLDGVDFIIVPSMDTAVSMYEASELDLVVVEAPSTRRVLSDERFSEETLLVPAAQIQYLGMNQERYEPFRDIRVREAVCRAIDFEALADGLFHGAAEPLAGQITEGVAGYNPDNVPVEYDPDRARALLAEAGYPGGEGLPPLRITGTEPNRLELAYYANQLSSELGMPVEVAVVERGTHLQAMNAGQVAFFPWAWTAAYPDGLYFLRDVWYGASPYNRSRWKNDAFDALIEEASETPDPEARFALYHEAERVLLSDWGTCPTVVEMQVVLKKPYVRGVHLTAFRFLPFGDVRLDAR